MIAIACCFLTIILLINASFEVKKGNLQEEICKNSHVDAATRTEDGIYLFRGDFTWKIGENGIVDGYPKRIEQEWKGMEAGPIDAAFTWLDGSTFLFKGEKYWKFVKKESGHDYPKMIRDGFPGIPDDLDAAISWEDNGYLYFFKGDKYWRYMPEVPIPISHNYPLKLSEWAGVPNNISAAIRWKRSPTYFFKGSRFYSYINNKMDVSKKRTANSWFKCTNGSDDVTSTLKREFFNRKEANESTNNIISRIEELRGSIQQLSLQIDHDN